VNSSTAGVFKNRNFRNYFGMNLSSRSATSVLGLVIVFYVFSVTASSIDVAIVGVTETLSAVILSLPAGVWVDRYNRIKLLVLSNAVRVLSVTILVLFSEFYGFSLIAVIVLLFSWNGASELYRSTSYSVLPDLVGNDRLASANGIIRTGTSLFSAVSNALGGTLILLVGASIALSYGSIGFLIAFLFSFMLLVSSNGTVKHNSQKREDRKNGFSEIREGFAWLLSQRGLFWLTMSALPFNFFFTISYYFLVVYVVSGMRSGALIFGAILAAYAVGYAIGSPLVGRTEWALKHAGRAWVIIYGAVKGVLLLLMGILPNPYLAIILCFVLGLSTGFAGNVWLTSAQNIVPVKLRGRYFAVDGLFSFIGGPPAVAVGGVLVLLIGIIPVYELSGIIMLIAALGFTLSKSLWRLDGTRVAE